MRATPALRGLRAGVFAALCVALAAAAHTLAMDATPPLWTMAASCAAVFVPSYLAASRERSLRAICGAMALLQVGLHLLFDATAVPHPAMPGMTGMTGMPGMPVDMPSMPGMSGMTETGGMGMGAHHAMGAQALAAHALAALAASWWLRRGEAAVWSLLRRAAALAPDLTVWARTRLTPPVLPPRVPVRADGRRRVHGLQLLLRHAVIRRGPPPFGPVPVPTM